MTRLNIILVWLCCILPTPLAEALTLAEPPEYSIVAEPRAGVFFIRKHNPKKTIEVRKASDLEIYWKVFIPSFDPHYSTVRVSVDGKFVVHAKGNFRVYSEEDVCVEVFGKEGRRDSYKVEELMPSLVKTGSKSDFVPKTKWVEKVRPVWLVHFVIELANGDNAVFRLDDRKVKVTKHGQHKAQK